MVRLLLTLGFAVACFLLVPTPLEAQTATAAPVTTYTLPPETLQKAEALYRTRIAMLFAGTAYSVVVFALVLGRRVAPRFRDIAERVSHRRFVQALVFVPLFVLTLDVLSLPIGLYEQTLNRASSSARPSPRCSSSGSTACCAAVRSAGGSMAGWG
jgi:hypothetical protein